MNNLIPSIQTQRLLLRPLLSTDADALHRIYQEEGVLQYFPSQVPPPIDRVLRFIDGQQAHWQKFGYGNWGIVPQGANEVIGWVGLQYLPELAETEVGFLFGRAYWGKGYATETALASLQYGFEQCGLAQIIALVAPDNLASRRVIEKIGMADVETLSLWGMELMRHRIERKAA
jgi:ribosomal-protein-alanine N-acetyltransferase